MIALLGTEAGGTEWKDLTPAQQDKVREFYHREPVGTERTGFTHYHFEESGVCTHAT